MSGSLAAFPSHLACVLYLAALPKPVQMRVIWMLLPCQVVMMLAEMFVAYQQSAGLESELPDVVMGMQVVLLSTGGLKNTVSPQLH